MFPKTRILHLKVQEYLTQKDQEVSGPTFGNRFAFNLCLSIPAIAIITANKPIFIFFTIIAFGYIVIEYHP
jgi:hypothetical protein